MFLNILLLIFSFINLTLFTLVNIIASNSLILIGVYFFLLIFIILLTRTLKPCLISISFKSFPLSLFGRGMGYHEDMDDENIFTLLLYLEDSNGGTQFKDNGRKIKSKRNRAIIFPARVEHQTVMQTNTLFRMNININFAVLPNGMEMVAV